MATTKFRQVAWPLPKELYDELEKVKAAAHATASLPLSIGMTEFAVRILAYGLAVYRKQHLPRPMIIDPFQDIRPH